MKILRDILGKRLAVLMLLSTVAVPSSAEADNYFVDQAKGNDAWSGKHEAPSAEKTDGPFATLTRARDAVRALKSAGKYPAEGITVWIRGGNYQLADTLVLTSQDSGTADGPVVYRPYGKEQVSILGGRPVSDFGPVTNSTILNRLSAEAKQNVRQVNLKQLGINSYGSLSRRGYRWQCGVYPSPAELFFNGEPMTLARYPNSNEFAKVASVAAANRFRYSGDRPKGWASSGDVWVHGYWGNDWADSWERVTSINTSNREVTTSGAGVYGYSTGGRYYFANVLEELDSPGEYYIDRNSGILYFWPPTPLEGSQAFVSTLDKTLIHLQGASNIVFRNLTIGHTRGHAICIDGGSNNVIAGSALKNIGNSAVVFNAGTNSSVISCDISGIGDDAIMIDGGAGMTGRTATRHTVHNNHIQNFSRWAKTYHPAVFLYGAEHNKVTHNYIHDAPHMAIGIWAGNNTIEYNKIHDVVREVADSGALYTIGRNLGYRNNLIRHNMFYNTRSSVASGTPPHVTMAIYLDDGAESNTVFGNVVFNAEYAIMMGGGRNNTMDNNIIVNVDKGIYVDKRMGYDPTGCTIRRNIFCNFDDWLFNHGWNRPNYKLFDIGNNIVFPLNNRFSGEGGNIVYNFGGQMIPLSVIGKSENPLFIDPAHSDYQLRDNSPAYPLGFQRIPIELIGLTNDEYRAGIPAPSKPPMMAAIDDKLIGIGELLSFLVAVDADDDKTLEFTASGLPAGAILDAMTGEFSWTPAADQSGVRRVTMGVSDGEASDSKAFNIVVLSDEPEVPQDYLAYWAFEDDTTEKTGTYHGTVDGVEAYDRGVIGKGYTLSNRTAAVELPVSLADATNPAATPVTISMWWRPATIENDIHDEVLIGGFTHHWLLGVPGNIPTAYIYNSSGQLFAAAGGTQIKPGQWAHTAAVYEAGTASIYVNGELEETGAWSGSFKPAATAMTIGARGNDWVGGILDETIIYRRRLFDKEIRNIYLAQDPFALNNPPVLEPVEDVNLEAGETIEFVLDASDPDGDPLTFSADNLPPGATLSPDGTFTWTTVYGQAGSYSITYTVSDGIAADSHTIAIIVEPAPMPPPVPPGADRPRMYVNAGEIAAIREKVQAGVEPWKSAFDALIADADSTLNAAPLAITDNGGGHYYRTDHPYITDGVYDPSANRVDYTNAILTGRRTRDLGLAYVFTGDARYAEKAIELIRVWCLDPATYMEPLAYNFGPHTPGKRSNIAIEVFITMPGILYGADLVWNYPGWNPAQKDALRTWAQRMANDARQRDISDASNPNNVRSWRLVLLAASAVIAEDDNLLNYAFNRYRDFLPSQIDSQGRMVYELSRTNSLGYSIYAINAMMQLAEIARHYDVDLYNHMASGGRGLQKALDFHAPYAINPATWPYQQIGNVGADTAAPFEVAYSVWQKPSYLDAVNRWKRPARESRIMGLVTLTHGNRFDLDIKPPAMPPTITPISDKFVVAGDTLSFVVEAEGHNDLPLTYETSELPEGAQFDGQQRTFTWTPAEHQVGVHTVSFTVSDEIGSSIESLNIVVAGQQLDIPADYAAYWSFDGNTGDAGGAYDGTTNRTLPYTEGTRLQAIRLDGARDYVEVPLSLCEKTNPASNAFTISMWWKPAAVESDTHDEVLLGGFTYHWFLSAPDNVPTAHIYSTEREMYAVSSNTKIEPGEWAHVAAVYGSDRSIRIYINGQLKNTGTWQGSFTPAGAYIRFGNRGDSFVAGDFDEALVYARALHHEEIMAIYQLQAPHGNKPPAFDTIADQSAVEGDTVQFTLSASDPDGNELAYSAEGLPAGATFDAQTAAFTWQTLQGDAGLYAPIFTVTDGELIDTLEVTITVLKPEPNKPPVFDSIAGRRVVEGDTVQFTLSATDPDGDELTYSAEGLPEGATFDAQTAAFTWQTHQGDAGAYTLTFTVSDGELTDTVEVNVTVVEPSAIPTGYLAHWRFDGNANDETDNFNGTTTGGAAYVEGIHGQALSLDGETGYVDLPLSLSQETDPLKRDTTVALWWKPSAIESDTHDEVLIGGFSYHWFLGVPNNVPTLYTYCGDREMHSVSSGIQVEPGVWVHIAAVLRTDHTISVYVNGKLAQSGSWNGSFVCAGLSFRIGNRGANYVGGEIDGAVIYANALSDSEISSIYAEHAPAQENRPPVFEPVPNTGAREGERLEFTLSAGDPDADTLTYSAENLPAGAEVNAQTGEFSWDVQTGQAGEYNLVFNVSDGGLSDTIDVKVTVLKADEIPQDYFARWRFDENLSDETGKFNAAPGGSLAYTDGVSGRAASLNGTNAFVELPLELSAATDPLADDLTIAMWWKPSSVESGVHDEALFAGFTYHWMLSVPGNVATVYIYSTDRQRHEVSSNVSLAAGKWAHIAAVLRKDQSIRVYVNGELKGSASWQGGFTKAGMNVRFGNRGDAFVGGDIDEAVIYKRALSADEIKLIYDSQMPPAKDTESALADDASLESML